MVAFSKTASCSVIIAGSILASLLFQIGVEGSIVTKPLAANQENIDSETRVLRRRKRGKGKGNGKGNVNQQEPESTADVRSAGPRLDLRLEQCLQDVIELFDSMPPTVTRTNSTDPPAADPPVRSEPSDNDEELLLIRRLSEGPDGFLHSRDITGGTDDLGTCNLEITSEMRAMVSSCII